MANTKSRTPRHRLIEADDDLREGVRVLRRKCQVMRHVHDTAGHPPLRRRPGGFEGLARIIVGQQVSVASAEAIWGRTVQAIQPFEPGVLLGLKDRTLVAAGLSGAKIRTLRASCAPSPRRAATASASPPSTTPAMRRSTPPLPRWWASDPGQPISTSCSAWAAPMPGRRAI